ncbi:MAG: ATP-binding protein [Candidatus Cloacimonetes bacterium]|nr:ATP-binding protein [Candidatus Cloacimonadota bacterium]MBS3767382.1 ATP-binding protein [Candidatus Cloacimonadota bacterium]
MKEIVVISGKGGTGKTSITASFAYLAENDIIVADCDVDAADMHLLLMPDFAHQEDFYSSEIAIIDQDTCTKCGECKKICRFDAISFQEDEYKVKPLDCEGCGYCANICPVDAITMEKQNDGDLFISTTKVKSTMVHASLNIGAENSGKLVAKVKSTAKEIAKKDKKEFVLVDGSPGIGCPVVSSLSGADYVVLVAEPTVAGIHDLKRVRQVVKNFNIKSGCIINKADLNKEKTTDIKEFLQEEDILHITDIPYDENFTKSMTEGKTIVEYDDKKLSEIIESSWKKILRLVERKEKS